MLFAFHQAANGDNWLTDEQIGKPYGFVTDSSSRAIGPEQSENGLSGAIPPVSGKLKEIEWLWLSNIGIIATIRLRSAMRSGGSRRRLGVF